MMKKFFKEVPTSNKQVHGKNDHVLDHTDILMDGGDKMDNANTRKDNSLASVVISDDDDSDRFSKKRKLVESTVISDENEDIAVPRHKKCRKSTAILSDSDSDYSPEKAVSPPKTPKSLPRATISPALSASRSAAANLSKFSRKSTAAVTHVEASPYLHHTLGWLKQNMIKDNKKRNATDENYDPKTLHVPPEFLNKCTPGMKQWWKIKSEHYDLILFFKVGKFYELYHMDAETAVKELGLIYMKGSFAHCGFPEKAFGRYSETLVQKGYRVGRIEQTERPSTKGKPVNRELCAVITKGSKTHSYLEGQSPEVHCCYLLAVCEKGDEFGVCFVDTSVGDFTLSQFSDDRHCSRLRTLISHYNVVQVLYTRREVSQKLQNVLSVELGEALHDPLHKGAGGFWSASKLQQELASGKYFVEDEGAEAVWPEVLKNMTAGETGGFNDEPLDEYKLALSSLGAVVYYLRSCLIERPLLTLKQFHYLTPAQFDMRSGRTFPCAGQRLVLDNTTISNLEILQTSEGKTEGSLLHILDRCVTAAGRRLLRQWVCAPLCSPGEINERLDAIDNLLQHAGKVKQVQSALRKVPDLDRLLRKIHTMGAVTPSQHPDSRAILYEEELYGKKKITDFVNSLEGFDTLIRVLGLFEDMELTSSLLKQTVCIDDDKGFPDLSKLLQFYKRSFDKDEALKKGIILPSRGVNEAYDKATVEIATIEEKFEDLLRRYKSQHKYKMAYFGSAKNRYQVEVTDSQKVPSTWEVQSQRKGYVRYYFPEAPALKTELFEAEIRKEAALKDTMRALFNRFSKHHNMWKRAVKCSATLDVLLSLSQYSASYDTCRPEITLSSPYIDIRDGNHPILHPTFSPGDFIPNDTTLGTESGTSIVLTGPNMGGKSTLMRQVGLLVILAQMGCRVPATSMSFSPVDRVFTRLGASDSITKGESTFFVELSETSTILRHASQHSLVLLDELGRGTATYDGTAIAGSVIENITRNIKCRTLFSTHYHRLVDELTDDVQRAHMSCMGSTTEDEQDITFLYKLSPGVCPKSFGFNAAKLAGVPQSVITEALTIAKQFEELSDKFHQFSKLLKPEADLDKLCSALAI